MRVLMLDGSLDISRAKDLQVRLIDVLESGEPITVDTGGAERVDTAAAQLLYAFSLAAHERGTPVNWRGPTLAVAEAFELLGLNAGLTDFGHAAPADPSGEAGADRKSNEQSQESKHGDNSDS